MNLSRLALFALPSLLAFLSSTAADEPQQTGIAHDSCTGALVLSWAGIPGRTYFIQGSFDLLDPWHFLPVIELGSGASLAYHMLLEPPAPRFFLRLRYTDQLHGGDPYAFDFSGGGLPAGWALEHGLNPFDPADAAKPAGSGLTWLELYQQSLGDGADPATTNAAALLVFTP